MLVESTNDWSVRALAPSYEAFLQQSGHAGSPALNRTISARTSAIAILEGVQRLCSVRPTLVAIDMPLSRSSITGRRVSDDAISRHYGARHAGTHTPSAIRPGPISDLLRQEFADAGYQLQTSLPSLGGLIEVYPHPALIELTGASRRLPYKVGKVRGYWPNATTSERRHFIGAEWAGILSHLEAELPGIKTSLLPPDLLGSVRSLKAFEDMLDALICAWVGIRALEGRAKPFGDKVSAIWVPIPTSA